MCRDLGMTEDTPVVIVSPSMSGSFSVPLLLRKPALFAGFVPIAPAIGNGYKDEDFAALTGVPALILYGELDNHGAHVSSMIHSMPGSQMVMIAGATHPAYLDKPEEFHELLVQFLAETAFPPES